MPSKTFYTYVLTYRGGSAAEDATHFAEAAFHDSQFPKQSTDYDELSSYIEMLSDEALTTRTFDELWESYASKYM